MHQDIENKPDTFSPDIDPAKDQSEAISASAKAARKQLRERINISSLTEDNANLGELSQLISLAELSSQEVQEHMMDYLDKRLSILESGNGPMSVKGQIVMMEASRILASNSTVESISFLVNSLSRANNLGQAVSSSSGVMDITTSTSSALSSAVSQITVKAGRQKT